MTITNIKVALTGLEFAHAFLSAYSDEGHIYLRQRNEVFYADNAHQRGKIISSSTEWNTAEDYINFVNYDASSDTYLFDLEGISTLDFEGVDYKEMALYFSKKGVPLTVPKDFDNVWLEYLAATQLLEFMCETDQIQGYRFRKSGEATYVYLKRITNAQDSILFYKLGISAEPDGRDFGLKEGASAHSVWQVQMPTFARAHQIEQSLLARYSDLRVAPAKAQRYLDNGFTECISCAAKELERERPKAIHPELFDESVNTENLDAAWNLADKFSEMRDAKTVFALDMQTHKKRVDLKLTYAKKMLETKAHYQKKIEEVDYAYQCSEPRNDFRRERKVGEWLGDLISSQDRRVKEERAHREWEVKRDSNPTRLALLNEKNAAIEGLTQEWMQLAQVATREELGL